MRVGTILLLLLLAPRAGALERDGRLDVILTPNVGRPAVVEAGQTFEALLRDEAGLGLRRDKGFIVLESESRPDSGLVRVTCRVPQTAAPGVYDLVAALEGGEEETCRAVHVVAEMPVTYTAAHVAAPRFPVADSWLEELTKRLAETPPAVLFVTGDLTASGRPEEYRRLLDFLNALDMPAYVVPGDADGEGYRDFFGPMPFVVRFGPDGFLGFEVRGPLSAPDWGEQAARIHPLRRSIKPCRWAVGLGNRYTPTMGMRTQLELFVDDPLDFLVLSQWYEPVEAPVVTVPWGSSRAFVPTKESDAASVRFFDVTPTGVGPHVKPTIEPPISDSH